MPQFVAGFPFFVGVGAGFVALVPVLAPENFFYRNSREVLPINALMEISVGVSIGALTFSGSIIAFLKTTRLNEK
ncbi:Unknown [Rickettsia africae ESF-5]|uniref:NADP transhydrogenase beta-like domain-containing protein n=1 Tax=Rickettsia africae (strain ESF-5) TaxID=347255 RepID=C3PNN2_RICAE|nr:Unknown [Rickettsia africae ESF-5]